MIKKNKIIVDKINSLEISISKLSDIQLQEKTIFFKFCLRLGKKLNDLLPEAYAVVREASKRVLKMRHFDVQLLGGIILNQNCIAEMQTGEGKTLTSTLPIYLNALEGNNVHVITMNEYLAKRDAMKNKALFEFLGLKVGLNLSNMSSYLKKKTYSSDIIYGTNNEFCFDYLRDNMVYHSHDRVQGKLNYALIDEVDSILIDESRTPLVISGESKNISKLYLKINKLVWYLIKKKKFGLSILNKKYLIVDEKSKQVFLTENGFKIIEKLLIHNKIISPNESLYSSNNIVLMHHITVSFRAHIIFKKNVDYIIKNKKVMIIDEHTGRIMEDRRWSDGLHQAIEAKENLNIFNENKTLASITFQNYFKLYNKISGMTGTAKTEAFEFNSIYNLNTITVPTNLPMIRKDFPDLIYLTEKEKLNAIIQDIKSCFLKKQPVLVGTVSIEKSEIISKKLNDIGIKHNVLNAKFNQKEAEIISQAGKPSSVTISTNMAGRGTDIVLGGALCFPSLFSSFKKHEEIKKIWKKEHDFVVSVGGLHVIGTERHESRRIDNQLIGRSGRQGDPGSSRFYLSLEDPLMRIFASHKVKNIIRNLGLHKGEAIEHHWINKVVNYAQRKVENRNFEIRKQVLEYDNILNDQRYIIYSKRNYIIDVKNTNSITTILLRDVILQIVKLYCPGNFYKKSWNIKGIEKKLSIDFNLIFSISGLIKKDKNISSQKIFNKIYNTILYYYKKKNIEYTNINEIEKNIMLSLLDYFWKNHLSNIDYLKQGIHFRTYAQKDPYQEYKRESFIMFSDMLDILRYKIVSSIIKNYIL